MSDNLMSYMSKKIKKGEEALKEKGNLFFIYGEAGAGKTSFCQNIKKDQKVLFISTESGNTDKFLNNNVSIIDINYVMSEYLKENRFELTDQEKVELKIQFIEEALELAWNSRDNFDAIIVDSMTDIVNTYYFNREYYVKKEYIARTGDTMLKRYKPNNFAIFEEIVKTLFKLVEKFKSAGTNFVMIFLEIFDEINNKVIPYIVGQAYKKQIAGQPDFLFYVENTPMGRKVHTRDGINFSGLKFNAKTRRDALNDSTPEELCNIGLGGVLELI